MASGIPGAIQLFLRRPQTRQAGARGPHGWPERALRRGFHAWRGIGGEGHQRCRRREWHVDRAEQLWRLTLPMVP